MKSVVLGQFSCPNSVCFDPLPMLGVKTLHLCLLKTTKGASSSAVLEVAPIEALLNMLQRNMKAADWIWAAEVSYQG